ncbi:MAG: hypothetical protein JOZ77_04565 [Candidatus Eremiobacteraeota bacterium]|nr:hypothetical protein [Candidatus Eremiobacteraeota bacterium]
MPKRLLFALAVGALAVAACHNGTPSTTPTVPATSPTPNPKITMAAVQVTINGTPAPRIPVEISTPRSTASPRPGTPFFTKNSGKKGFARFNHLKPSQTYCWVAIFSQSFRSSFCADWQEWQSGTIPLGSPGS